METSLESGGRAGSLSLALQLAVLLVVFVESLIKRNKKHTLMATDSAPAQTASQIPLTTEVLPTPQQPQQPVVLLYDPDVEVNKVPIDRGLAQQPWFHDNMDADKAMAAIDQIQRQTPFPLSVGSYIVHKDFLGQFWVTFVTSSERLSVSSAAFSKDDQGFLLLNGCYLSPLCADVASALFVLHQNHDILSVSLSQPLS